MSSEWRRRDTDAFARVWAEVKRLREESSQRVNYLLRNAGLRVAEGALHVLQRLVVEGDQEVTGTLDVGGTAAFSGDTEIGGNLKVTGTLSLPAGIIDNDALANPVRYDSGFANSVDHPTITTSEQALATFSIP